MNFMFRRKKAIEKTLCFTYCVELLYAGGEPLDWETVEQNDIIHNKREDTLQGNLNALHRMNMHRQCALDIGNIVLFEYPSVLQRSMEVILLSCTPYSNSLSYF